MISGRGSLFLMWQGWPFWSLTVCVALLARTWKKKGQRTFFFGGEKKTGAVRVCVCVCLWFRDDDDDDCTSHRRVPCEFLNEFTALIITLSLMSFLFLTHRVCDPVSSCIMVAEPPSFWKRWLIYWWGGDLFAFWRGWKLLIVKVQSSQNPLCIFCVIDFRLWRQLQKEVKLERKRSTSLLLFFFTESLRHQYELESP